ncbi:MAG TPA: hypothetical protein VKY74_03325 [Chloroflexia bacterium]|nr:hypothetical protein [Chloroflexia bacterium]
MWRERGEMLETRSERYHYQGGVGFASWCYLQVYRGAGDDVVVVVCSEDPQNPGTAITNWAEHLAYAIWREEGQPRYFCWIEHYPESTHPGDEATCDLVQFRRRAGGEFYDPQWQHVGCAAAEKLTQQEDLTALPEHWRSIAPPSPWLNCRRCGQDLGAGEVLAGAGLCTSCQQQAARRGGV